jgi:hypothetical protein
VIDELSRRRLLLGASGLGAATVGAGRVRAALGLDPVPLTRAATVGPLSFRWREAYNGRVLESTGFGAAPEGTAGDAVVSIPEAMPGDAGSLVAEIGKEPGATGYEDGVRVSLGLFLCNVSENGLTEPEAAVDSTPNRGELQEHVDVTLWYDTGVGGIDLMGARNETPDPGEPVLITDVPIGTAGVEIDCDAPLADQITDEDLVALDPEPETLGTECLTDDLSVTLGFAWSIDEEVGNVIQTDRIGLQLTFVSESCA